MERQKPIQLSTRRPAEWFHRLVLDPIFDPTANLRHEVALGLLQGGQRLLDIGCWDGHLLELVHEAELYQDLYGVDVVTKGIKAVRAKGFQAQVVNLNRELLPFPDEYFDGITILAVLEHIFDPCTVAREIHRVLRPGGELVLDVPNCGLSHQPHSYPIGTCADYFRLSYN